MPKPKRFVLAGRSSQTEPLNSHCGGAPFYPALEELTPMTIYHSITTVQRIESRNSFKRMQHTLCDIVGHDKLIPSQQHQWCNSYAMWSCLCGPLSQCILLLCLHLSLTELCPNCFKPVERLSSFFKFWIRSPTYAICTISSAQIYSRKP